VNRKLELEVTAYTLEQLAGTGTPQIAVAGRSNVGKSSLINTLAGRKNLAKTSQTPGKTRSINYYRALPGGYYLVDLPGYGYAKTSKAERQKWAELIGFYMEGNPDLKAVAMLLDSRLEPQKLDLELTSYLTGKTLPILPVLTKADKCKTAQRARRQNQWREILRSESLPLLFSSKTGLGRDRLWESLDAAAGRLPTGSRTD
jgi:GTP-binding protein